MTYIPTDGRPVMSEVAVYNWEDGCWYRNGETPWVVRNVPVGKKLIPFFNVKADTYMDAFMQLYGHAQILPVTVRSRREIVLN